MQLLASPSGSFSLATKIWKTGGKSGLRKKFKHRVSQGMTGEWDPRLTEVGEVAASLQ